MKTPEEQLANQLSLMKDCTEFLAEHVPLWQIDAVDPVEGLESGIVSCAGLSAIAITYLGIRGMPADFAFQTAHGRQEGGGEIQIGHALTVAHPVMSFMRVGIDSFSDCQAKTRIITPARLLGYHVVNLEQGFPEYCYLARMSASLDGLTDAVARRM